MNGKSNLQNKKTLSMDSEIEKIEQAADRLTDKTLSESIAKLLLKSMATAATNERIGDVCKCASELHKIMQLNLDVKKFMGRGGGGL